MIRRKRAFVGDLIQCLIKAGVEAFLSPFSIFGGANNYGIPSHVSGPLFSTKLLTAKYPTCADMSIRVLTLVYKKVYQYSMDMARKKKMVTLTLDPELVARLEAWLERQEFPPAKNAVIEAALRKWLDERDET